MAAPGHASLTPRLPSPEAAGKGARAAWRGAGGPVSCGDSSTWDRVTLIPGRCLWHRAGAHGQAQRSVLSVLLRPVLEVVER